MSEFTHFDQKGQAIMVDVSDKVETRREAIAQGTIYMSSECFHKVMHHEMGKGDVLSVARIAGIMGAKRTSDLIPLCHIIALTKVEINFQADAGRHAITAECIARCIGPTGVEMEALCGVSTALLTIYDMCKAVDKTMHMENIHLCRKSGGKSGLFVNGSQTI